MGVELSRTHSALRSKYDRERKAKQVKFVIGLLVFAFLVVVWNSSLPSQTLPGARRGDFRPEVARGGDLNVARTCIALVCMYVGVDCAFTSVL